MAALDKAAKGPPQPELRIQVIGPNGEEGSVPASTFSKGLPAGWQVRGQVPKSQATIGPASPGLKPVESRDVEVPGGPDQMDIFDTGLKKAFTLDTPEGPKTIYPKGINARGENKLSQGYREGLEFLGGGVTGTGVGSAAKKAIQTPLMRKALTKAGETVGEPAAAAARDMASLAAENTSKAASAAKEYASGVAAKSKEGLADTLRAIEKRILSGRGGQTATDLSIFEEPVAKATQAAEAAGAKAGRAGERLTQSEGELGRIREMAQGLADKSLSAKQAVKDTAPGLGTIAGGALGHMASPVAPVIGPYFGSRIGGHAASKLAGIPSATGWLAPARNIEYSLESPALYYQLSRLLPYMGGAAGLAYKYPEEE